LGDASFVVHIGGRGRAALLEFNAMSYQVLARKWRPKSFGSLVGQAHVVRALSHALDSGRLHHAWLFTGTRGVGKTTIARILAKALNCETGVTSEPCGQCDACLAIDADRFPDYVEMDAASNRGVDDMAALLDRAVYAPVQGRYKVYMIDEVHMLTGHAFNAMLKTLEEPPEHVKFILATTDPQKIPVTVLSRCLQFNLKQMPAPGIVEHLGSILEAEKVPFDQAALTHIAKGANGSMRDALSLLDQAIAHGGGQVDGGQVSQMLGTVGDDHLVAVLEALVAGDVEAMLAAADDMQARALSFDDALQTLASWLHRIAVAQFAPAALPEGSGHEHIAVFAERFDAEYLQLAYQTVIHGRDELALAPDEYAGFTMTLLRLHAFRPESPARAAAISPAGEGAVRAVPGGESSRGAAEHAVRESQSSGAALRGRPQPAAGDGARQAQAVALASSGAAGVPPWETSPEQSASAQVSVDDEIKPQQAVKDLTATEGLLESLARGDWHRAQHLLRPSGLIRELCQHCEWVGFEENRLTLRLGSDHGHLLEMNPDLGTRLSALFAERGHALRVKVEVGDIAGATPAQRDKAERQRRHKEAVAALERDPFVCEVVERFDATLNEASVKPL